ncbi:MAG TPA: hypothetical protein PKH32_01460 [Verrucomicrobiota bacterium]|nr:hypothetical protein [Verrucomicrobiota bacterium]
MSGAMISQLRYVSQTDPTSFFNIQRSTASASPAATSTPATIQA